MKITIKAIPPEGMDIQEELTASDLNLETTQIHYADSVRVAAHVEKDKDIINVDCNITSRKRQTCSRCLSEFESSVKSQIDFVYKIKSEHVIDLNDNIRDTIILDYPMKMLCKPNCKGLCFHCGKNLNEGPCGCGGK